jgi:hypothetical protein
MYLTIKKYPKIKKLTERNLTPLYLNHQEMPHKDLIREKEINNYIKNTTP